MLAEGYMPSPSGLARALSWRILVCGALLCITGACGGEKMGPSRAIAYAELLGHWALEVRDTASCAGLAEPVAVTLSISQQADDASNTQLVLQDGASRWAAPGYGGGYVTGSLPLSVPAVAIFTLVLGAPPTDSDPGSQFLAQFRGTLTADLELRGVLLDPLPGGQWKPIFSTALCELQLRGAHS
jgi:hypothetical protein